MACLFYDSTPIKIKIDVVILFCIVVCPGDILLKTKASEGKVLRSTFSLLFPVMIGVLSLNSILPGTEMAFHLFDQ